MKEIKRVPVFLKHSVFRGQCKTNERQHVQCLLSHKGCNAAKCCKKKQNWPFPGKSVGNANPGRIFQTRVYGFDGLQTRVPGGRPVITVM